VHAALRDLVPEGSRSEEERDLPDLVDELEDLARAARAAAAALLGPAFSWRAAEEPPADALWAPVIVQLDLDRGRDDDPAGVSDIREWEDSAIDLAARAYARETSLDHPPGEGGIWLLSLAPYSHTPIDDRPFRRGMLTGFVVLHDRDTDGRYESLAHIWTAAEWRRRGVGRSLVKEARARFPLTRAEGPFTPAGCTLLRSSAAELLP